VHKARLNNHAMQIQSRMPSKIKMLKNIIEVEII